MTRKLFTILSICFTVNAFAQPVINASDFDLSSTDGYKYKHDFYFEEQLDPGSAGANVSWDFSALDFPWEYSVSFEKCPGADCDRVPTATNHYNSPGGDIYVNKTAAFLEKVGKINDSELSEYTNPYRQIEFPMTFNQIYKDDYVLDSELPATGNLTSTIDAYGTLKTPSGTFSNTLRQKIVDVREVRHPAMVITITDTYYKWYKAGVSVCTNDYYAFTKYNMGSDFTIRV